MFYAENKNLTTSPLSDHNLDHYLNEMMKLIREHPDHAREIMDGLHTIVKNAPEYLALLFPISPQ